MANTNSLRPILERNSLRSNGANYFDWLQNLRNVLRRERKEYVLTTLLPEGEESPLEYIPMQTVMKSEDLDKLLTDGFTFDMASSINENLQALGMHPERKVPYIKAVKEGWAPAPTNDIQKAIWDKVHAAPKNPMKIEFDPKKGR